MWYIQENGRNECRPEDRSRIGGATAIRAVIDAVNDRLRRAASRVLRGGDGLWF